MKGIIFIGFVFCLFWVKGSFASDLGWVYEKTCVPNQNDSISATLKWKGLDTLIVKAGLGSQPRLKVFRNGQRILLDQDYQILPGDSALYFAAPWQEGDSVCLEIASTPLFHPNHFSLYRLDQIPIYRFQNLDSSVSNANLGLGNLEDTSYSKYRLNYSGSKSLSMTMGSGGGLGLDGALFINLDGQIAEDVFLEGQLSDQNVPIQPEGNTTTLKEIDTKFMRVYGKHYSFILGNYLMEYGRENEDRFTAKVEGVEGRISRGEYGLQGSWSISDGLFQSDTLRGADGKQRGYYLRGKGGRQFITVLAGTERISRNGQPLKRGIDYTIDYAEGRIDFLPSLLITSENLFSAEYQYTEQDYQRSLLAGEIRDTAGAFTWSLRSISELENKDNPLALVLDSENLKRFAAAGDSNLVDTSLGKSGRFIRMPQQQSGAAMDLHVDLPHYQGDGSLLFSQLDRNLYSDKQDENNLGYSTRYHAKQGFGKTWDQGGYGETDLLVDHEFRSLNYSSFKQVIDSRSFLELWNLNSSLGESGFLANRLTLEERPYKHLLLSSEFGLANTISGKDSSMSSFNQNAESKRGALKMKLGNEKTFFETSTEAKWAMAPLQQDNYRQWAHLQFLAAGFIPEISWTRNEWLAAQNPSASNSSLSRSIKEEPQFHFTTPQFFDAMQWTSGLLLLNRKGNFAGTLGTVQDSVRDIGLTQKLEILGIGPWSSDIFYSFHKHQLWQLDSKKNYANSPEENNFNQLEWNNHLSNYKQGYSFGSSYRISQTAELPLVEAYDTLKGRGNYSYDPVQRIYNKVEVGGDYILVGLVRDTTLGTKPYQDLSFSSNLELVPAKFPFPVSGFFADIEFDFDLSLEHQDTTNALGLYPRFLDAQIEEARSGRSRYSPSLHWKAPEGHRTLDFYADRSFNLVTGFYASKEKLWNQRANFRQEINDLWEYRLEQSFENRSRENLVSSTTALSENQNQTYGAKVLRKLPKAFSLEGRGQYLLLQGDGTAGITELQGIKPGLKLEKGSLYNGRVFLDYGLIYFWGQGEGSFYTTGEYAPGLTHRIEANANFQVGQNMYLNFNYIWRQEPGGDKITQKLSAEARAVF